jgi:hypothetical protein
VGTRVLGARPEAGGLAGLTGLLALWEMVFDTFRNPAVFTGQTGF